MKVKRSAWIRLKALTYRGRRFSRNIQQSVKALPQRTRRTQSKKEKEEDYSSVFPLRSLRRLR
jgi:hypothetical protein